MNNREREILRRLQCVLSDIPNPAAGTQTSSYSGIFGFAKDMKEIKEAMCSALFHVRTGELAEAETLTSNIETWIKLREEQDWQNVKPYPKIETLNS